MKSVLISIQPRWCALIANGRKTVEVRKNRPKLEPPFRCYIYCTMGNPHDPHQRLELHTEDGKIHLMNGTVIGEFVCEGIETIECGSEDHDYWSDASCLSRDDFIRYCNGKELYGWHISDLKIYDKPKKLNEFWKPCICPKMPYCPACPVGYEYISEEEAEFYRVDGECNTEWVCANYLKRPPQSWCYVEAIQEVETS